MLQLWSFCHRCGTNTPLGPPSGEEDGVLDNLVAETVESCPSCPPFASEDDMVAALVDPKAAVDIEAAAKKILDAIAGWAPSPPPPLESSVEARRRVQLEIAARRKAAEVDGARSARARRAKSGSGRFTPPSRPRASGTSGGD